MDLCDFLAHLDAQVAERGKAEQRIELNFFVYTYIAGVSRVAHGGQEYLCLSAGWPLFGGDLTEAEKKMCNQAYHVYRIAPMAAYEEDETVRQAVIEIYRKQLDEYAKTAPIKTAIIMSDPSEDDLW